MEQNKNTPQGQLSPEQFDGMNSADTGTIVKLISRKDESISNLLVAVKSFSAENEQLKKEIAQIRAEHEKIKVELSDAVTAISTTAKSQSDLSQENEDLKKKSADLQEAYNKIRDELNEALSLTK